MKHNLRKIEEDKHIIQNSLERQLANKIIERLVSLSGETYYNAEDNITDMILDYTRLRMEKLMFKKGKEK